MALRWCAAGMLEAAKQFRRVNGHLWGRIFNPVSPAGPETQSASSELNVVAPQGHLQRRVRLTEGADE